ncbi:MAG: hypothetical protein JW810_09490 [Sedimentisphaerales bacterium]|nr:hypothetical protein [Sedimentisphaerales bacterium]
MHANQKHVIRPNGTIYALLCAVAITVVAVLAAAPAAAEAPADADKNSYVWDGSVRAVSIFKNGYGFFLREGPVQLRDGWCLARQVPPAAFGTLAVYSADPEHTIDLVGAGPGEIIEFDGTDVPADIEYKRQRLAACRHLSVALHYREKGEKRSSCGKMVSLGPEYAVLAAAEQNLAVPVAAIEKLQILEMPVRVHVENGQDKPARQTTLGMAYLRQGITWIPEYTLDIVDDQTAQLTLRGTLINEAEDLIHCDVNFVVGVPHFLHTDYMAPLAVGQAIRTIGAAVAPAAVRTQIASRAALTSNIQTADQFDPLKAAGFGAMGNLPAMDAAAGTDFTVYTKKDLTLRCGEKAIVTLFVKTIRYGHVYHWDPPERIRHFLVLHNQTDTAWTTGPYLAIQRDNPLSEDLLKYTPRQGTCQIPVTQAVNISTRQEEREIDRKLKAHNPQSNLYLDLVRLTGELRLGNFETEPVQIILDVAVPGKPEKASDDGQLHTDSGQLKLTERRGRIRWDIQLKPQESKSLTYEYERYVPSY